MNYQTFSMPERLLALLAGVLNLVIGLGFFFLPELQQSLPFHLWPTKIPDLLTRFIGAIILGNGVGALWLSRERDWARVRPLALVATIYGTLVAVALLYHLLWLRNTPSAFWFYFVFDLPFLIIFYVLFFKHDILPLVTKRSGSSQEQRVRR
jgi:hypothetical protein